MPTKTKATVKAVKPAVKKTAAKAKPAVKKAVAKAKAGARSVACKAPAKSPAQKKKPATLMQSVKAGVQAGLGSVGDLVKKVTPDALLPKSAKAKRK